MVLSFHINGDENEEKRNTEKNRELHRERGSGHRWVGGGALHSCSFFRHGRGGLCYDFIDEITQYSYRGV